MAEQPHPVEHQSESTAEGTGDYVYRRWPWEKLWPTVKDNLKRRQHPREGAKDEAV